MAKKKDELDEQLPYEQGALEADFLAALEAHSRGNVEAAEAGFRTVLLGDPRLPEPRLELAVILFRRQELVEAESQARLALEQIEKGWQWLDNFSSLELEAFGASLLGEILLARATDLDDGGGAGLWRESETLLRRALELDPDNDELKSRIAGFRRKKRSR